MSMPDNPRERIGDNQAPDYAKTVTEQMKSDYAEVVETTTSLLAEARELPARIEDDETKSKFAHVIKRLRDVRARIEAFQKKEKEPYLRGGQAVDQFFFGLIDKIARRDRKANAGAADILLARLTEYDTRKLEEERARRQRELDEAARVEREAREKAIEAARLEEEARQAAERARKPERIEEKTAVADQRAVDADVARVDVLMATDKADAAELATKASAADIMRTRDSDTGTLTTMATEKFAVILDRTKLDKEKLWPHIASAELEKALRAYAATVDYSADAAVQIEGARFGRRPKSSVR